MISLEIKCGCNRLEMLGVITGWRWAWNELVYNFSETCWLKEV